MNRCIFFILPFLILISCSEEKTISIIKLEKADCTIYLKKVVWGITGDNYCTYISTNKELKDTVNEPYLRSMDFFFKLNPQCKLEVFNSDSLKGKNRLLGKKVNVVINNDANIKYSEYQNLGLKSILWEK